MCATGGQERFRHSQFVLEEVMAETSKTTIPGYMTVLDGAGDINQFLALKTGSVEGNSLTFGHVFSLEILRFLRKVERLFRRIGGKARKGLDVFESRNATELPGRIRRFKHRRCLRFFARCWAILRAFRWFKNRLRLLVSDSQQCLEDTDTLPLPLDGEERDRGLVNQFLGHIGE